MKQIGVLFLLLSSMCLAHKTDPLEAKEYFSYDLVVKMTARVLVARSTSSLGTLYFYQSKKVPKAWKGTIHSASALGGALLNPFFGLLHLTPLLFENRTLVRYVPKDKTLDEGETFRYRGLKQQIRNALAYQIQDVGEDFAGYSRTLRHLDIHLEREQVGYSYAKDQPAFPIFDLGSRSVGALYELVNSPDKEGFLFKTFKGSSEDDCPNQVASEG